MFICSGGINITVTGTALDTIQHPEMLLWLDQTQYKGVSYILTVCRNTHLLLLGFCCIKQRNEAFIIDNIWIGITVPYALN